MAYKSTSKKETKDSKGIVKLPELKGLGKPYDASKKRYC